MRAARTVIIVLLAGLSLAFLHHGASLAGDSAAELRREKARLLQMKAREEKTAAELTDALRKEKLTKKRVGELQDRLKRQQRVLSGIDRKLSALGGRLDLAEKEVREIMEAQGRARGGLRRAAVLAFTGNRAASVFSPARSHAERERYFMRAYLGADLREIGRASCRERV